MDKKIITILRWKSFLIWTDDHNFSLKFFVSAVSQPFS